MATPMSPRRIGPVRKKYLLLACPQKRAPVGSLPAVHRCACRWLRRLRRIARDRQNRRSWLLGSVRRKLFDVHRGDRLADGGHRSADGLSARLGEGSPSQPRIRRIPRPARCRLPAATAIKIILDNHSAHLSRETKTWLAARPAGRFQFVFAPNLPRPPAPCFVTSALPQSTS